MGIEQFDYLYAKSQEMLGYFTVVNSGISDLSTAVSTLNSALGAMQTTLTNVNLGIDTVQAAITNENYVIASSMLADTKTIITGLKSSITATGLPTSEDITAMQETLVSATELVNSLIPLITSEIEKIAGDGNTTYIYTCSGCSLACVSTFKFAPPDVNALKFCQLRKDESANYTQTEVRVIS